MTITITEDAAKALVRLAQAQRREPRAQAAVLLTRALADRPILDPSGSVSDVDDAEASFRSGRGSR